MALCSCGEPSAPRNAPVAGAIYQLHSVDGVTLPYRAQEYGLLPDTTEDSRVALRYLLGGRLEFDHESLATRRMELQTRCRNAATGEPLPCEGPTSAVVTARLRYTVHAFGLIGLQDTAPCGWECIPPVLLGVLDSDDLVVTDAGHAWRWRRSRMIF